MPPRIQFGEAAPGGERADNAQNAPVLTPEQEAFLRRSLGVDPAQVAEALAADAAANVRQGRTGAG